MFKGLSLKHNIYVVKEIFHDFCKVCMKVKIYSFIKEICRLLWILCKLKAFNSSNLGFKVDVSFNTIIALKTSLYMCIEKSLTICKVAVRTHMNF